MMKNLMKLNFADWYFTSSDTWTVNKVQNIRVLTIESQKIDDHDRDHFFGDRYDRQIPFKDRDLFTRSHFDFAKSIPIPF